MSATRKALFALATLGMALLLLEGAARLVWWRLEHRALGARQAQGEAALRNDSINFMKQADQTLGYVLKPGVKRGSHEINADGFDQRDVVPLTRRAGVLRVAAMGESTTQGHNTDRGNYPVYLRSLLRAHGLGYPDVEMINAGVSGWISDQVALWAAGKVTAYAPDIVVLYVGWNDFQSYDPFRPPPTISYFEEKYGRARFIVDASPLKLIPLSSALYDYAVRRLGHLPKAPPSPATAGAAGSARAYGSAVEVNYRFYLASLDRIVAAFRRADPGVRIAICTLVGRWPAVPAASMGSGAGASYVWWMTEHDLTPAEAAAALARFNDLIRDYARSRHLLLIDAAAAFSELDRGRLQWDFAHLTAEGYELLAEVIYEGLRQAGDVRGEISPRRAQLEDAYRAPARQKQDAAAPRESG